MRALTAAELLAVREQGDALSPPRRALLLLGAACPESSPDELGRLPVGRRDDLLLALRAAAFGPRLAALARCARCQERVEVAFDTDALRRPADGAPVPLELQVGGHALGLRLPDGADLVALADAPDAAQAERELLRRCVLSARCGARDVAPDELPEPVVAALAERLAEADPLADVRIALACPGCGQQWTEPFDIVGFFWREIEAWAERLLQDVHALASAYGWSERDILALPPARRRQYLELVAS